MMYFNAGINLNGICFNCLNKNTELCKECMKLCAEKPSKGKMVDDIAIEPHFRDLWDMAIYDSVAEDTALALELDGDGKP